MLTLLEPPGGKRASANPNRSAQHLLNLGGGVEEDEYYDDYDQTPAPTGKSNPISNFLERHLVWKSSSDEYSERWKREWRQRPSWGDADLCLQQIARGRARGNKGALYSRSLIQKTLFWMGNAVQDNAWPVILTLLTLFSICCYGLQYVRIETDIVKLWVSNGGRLDAELNFLNRVKESANYNASDEGSEIVRENGLGGGYQVVIQTPEYEGQNALTYEQLMKHVEIMEEIASMRVDVYNESWSLSDICFKPSPPELAPGTIAGGLADTIDRVVPCIWITPIDCYWEGARALGPHPALYDTDMGLLSMLQSVPNGVPITWKNLNPGMVIDEVDSGFKLGTHKTFFDRAGIGAGYLDRPCLDPMDPECPRDAPNYFDVCPYLDAFLEFAKRDNLTVEVEEDKSAGLGWLTGLFGGKKRRKRDVNATGSVEGIPAAPALPLATEAPTTTTTQDPVAAAKEAELARKRERKRCQRYHKGIFKWLKQNPIDKWTEFLPQGHVPQYPDHGAVMSGGCPGFARGLLHWPEDMIMGGAKRREDGQLDSADALQSVFLVASPNDVYLRFKSKPNRTKAKTGLNESEWSPEMAESVIQAWQRNFTKALYNHKHNFVPADVEGGAATERRTIHPLASTSIADMLEEFCQFNYTIILVGYGLMLVYAMVTQLRREGCLPAAHSCMGLALGGVLTVTFASVAGLGLATWFGIEFNAATTQIVPFLTLGIGVDNMFMLLHNYHDVVLMTGRHELGVLMRETGMSILCTSINNILSFLAGTMLPIPALRSFCAQSSILLTFNFIAMLTLYPALISLDLKRRKAGRRDLLLCLFTQAPEEAYSMITKPAVQEKKTVGETNPAYRNLMAGGRGQMSMLKEVEMEEEDREPAPYSLHAAIRNYYIPFISTKGVKTFVLIMTACLLAMSAVGIKNAQIGLELADILPEHTAPAAFLKARDQYFSFYPMFAVIKGPIDYAAKQKQIDNYRNEIGRSSFVIKNKHGAPSEKYWMQLMREWVVSLDKSFKQAIAKGIISVETGEIVGYEGHNGSLPQHIISEEALIAYRLVCSHGDKYQCKGRVGYVDLIDASGVIRPDSFYNVLTAWFSQDNMMYYVSQASFFPAPPKWSPDDLPNLVPPAEPLAYSQIPFYLTGLTGTPSIVEMIKEIREKCDEFDAAGLPNFPQGIAFTFWEQYLHLTGNLMQAIAIIALAVFFVISVLLWNPWAAACVLSILVCMTVQLAGFMGWAGVKMNPVSAVTLITAVGIGVEFTAHVVLAFLTALGSHATRTAAAVDRVFVPVIHGALSTLLGILMLGFSEFEFVVKYFFVVMSALIVIGLLNGLALLPVLLSLAGPRCEVRPLDGRPRLQLPPPLRRRQPVAETDDEDEPITMYPRQ